MKSSKENRTGSTVFVDVIAREKREYCVLVRIGCPILKRGLFHDGLAGNFLFCA